MLSSCAARLGAHLYSALIHPLPHQWGGRRKDQVVALTAQAVDDHSEIGLALLPGVHRRP